MDSTQGFHAVMNLLLMPKWLLSGAFLPASGAPSWLRAVMQANPLTCGVTVAFGLAGSWRRRASRAARADAHSSPVVSVAGQWRAVSGTIQGETADRGEVVRGDVSPSAMTDGSATQCRTARLSAR